MIFSCRQIQFCELGFNVTMSRMQVGRSCTTLDKDSNTRMLYLSPLLPLCSSVPCHLFIRDLSSIHADERDSPSLQPSDSPVEVTKAGVLSVNSCIVWSTQTFKIVFITAGPTIVHIGTYGAQNKQSSK